MSEHHLNALVGVPYLRGGRDPEVALDCWGLVMVDAECRGLRLPDLDNECPATSAAIVRKLATMATYHATPIAAPTDGCMVYDAKRGHIGLFYGGRVYHAANPGGVRCDRLDIWLDFYPGTEYFQWRL